MVAGVGHSGGDVLYGFRSHEMDFEISLQDTDTQVSCFFFSQFTLETNAIHANSKNT